MHPPESVAVGAAAIAAAVLDGFFDSYNDPSGMRRAMMMKKDEEERPQQDGEEDDDDRHQN